MHLLASMSSQAYDAALALIYPQACAICGHNVESRHDGVSCARCWAATQLFDKAGTLCWKCGSLSRVTVSENKRPSIRCGRCDEDAFNVARACGSYEGALRASILGLKREPHVGRRLLLLLHEVQMREPLNTVDVIVPVPLHSDRERERGFNQAVVIANELACLSHIPIDEHSVVRRLHTERHRAGMDAKARRKSVAGAFAVRHHDLIAGKHVLLVDDVFTTGATASACAKALRDSGATAVSVLTIARA